MRLIYIVLSIWCAATWAVPKMHVSQSEVSRAALPIYVGWVGANAHNGPYLRERFLACLEHSGQFAPHLECLDVMPRMRDALNQRFHEGYMLAVFVGCTQNQLEWRLYDVAEGTLLQSRTFSAPAHERIWVYTAAHALWHTLTQQQAPFLSHIAYIKETPHKRNRQYTLCIADFDGAYEQSIMTTHRYIMTPQWGWIDGEPVIFFSEFTRENVRIRVANMHGSVRTILDLDGTSVGFVQRQNEMLYCRSGIIWRCHHDATRGKRIHTPLIRESNVCASPTVDASGNIYYCCRGMIKYFDRKAGIGRPVVYQGYAVAPSYHIERDALLYTQRHKGVMQVCMYTLHDGQIQHITHDAGDKMNPDWSPCGAYIIYANARDNRIYSHHIATGCSHAMTPRNVTCRSPSWSPRDICVA